MDGEHAIGGHKADGPQRPSIHIPARAAMQRAQPHRFRMTADGITTTQQLDAVRPKRDPILPYGYQRLRLVAGEGEIQHVPIALKRIPQRSEGRPDVQWFQSRIRETETVGDIDLTNHISQGRPP